MKRASERLNGMLKIDIIVELNRGLEAAVWKAGGHRSGRCSLCSPRGFLGKPDKAFGIKGVVIFPGDNGSTGDACFEDIRSPDGCHRAKITAE